ncbi:hypothetical protein [Nocardia sp. NPDC047648]|uniref:hypothetical protein n=1 Tax=Nocardia sp. NPDC047648 TaxID=3155625 RepID=UPI0033DE9AE8
MSDDAELMGGGRDRMNIADASERLQGLVVQPLVSISISDPSRQTAKPCSLRFVVEVALAAWRIVDS